MNLDINNFFSKCEENKTPILLGALGLIGTTSLWSYYRRLKKSNKLIVNQTIDWDRMNETKPDQQSMHHFRRRLSYPAAVSNTWYHILDSSELKNNGEVIQVKALNRVFAMWRTADGRPVCQDAFCIHLGANLAVGGKIKDDCIECPFHKWKFGEDGSIKEIPYLKDGQKCPTTRKLTTYSCKDWCGLVCVYIHSDGEDPTWAPPPFLEKILEEENWAPHLNWDIGFKTLSPVDWVDQAGDYSHFQTLHGDFLIPWTLIPIPKWIYRIFPLSIYHELFTMKGDDPEWKERVAQTGWGVVDQHYIYFTDLAGLKWNDKVMDHTLSETVEMFIGPAMMCFNIPFTIGALKAFVTTTPVDGGSIMRVRTWCDSRVMHESFLGWKRYLAWLITGVSASQLQADIDIMCSKIRLRKPVLQPFDGPYSRMCNWLKLFYTNGDTQCEGSNWLKTGGCDGAKPYSW